MAFVPIMHQSIPGVPIHSWSTPVMEKILGHGEGVHVLPNMYV